jgi:deoxyribonuclease-4
MLVVQVADVDKCVFLLFSCVANSTLANTMADRPRFGPAGTPWTFKELKQPITELPSFLHEIGLDALEYEAVRWGQKPQIKKENAEKLGLNAKKHDVWLSMHGSYFISLHSKRAVVEASKKRLLACATAAQWMNAHLVVFHPGVYGRKNPKEVLRQCIKATSEVVEEMKSLGITVKLGPETMGKRSQFGSLDEVLTLCEQVEQTEPVVDWSHLHARTRGKLRTYDDFLEVIDETEKRLGTETAKNLHCHFSRMEFSSKGEVRHHVLDDKYYGPEFGILARVVVDLGLRPVIICESPLIDVDAIKMRNVLREEVNRKG